MLTYSQDKFKVERELINKKGKRIYQDFLFRAVVCFTVSIIFVLTLFYFAEAQEGFNLTANPGFEQASSGDDNLWDGVDRSGNLKMIGSSAPSVADINNDGKKDIVCGDKNWFIWYYLNSGTNEQPVFTRAEFVKARFDHNTKPFVVDWNNDGRNDILLGLREGWVCLLKNKAVFGRPKFISKPSYEFFKTLVTAKKQPGEFIKTGSVRLDIGQFSAPAAADWNKDNKKDLILGEGTYSANSVYVYLNTGTDSKPVFEKDSRQYLAYGEGKTDLRPAPMDWDNDGDLDLIVGEEQGYLHLYLNKAGKQKTLLKKGIEVLEYAGRIKAQGRDIDVGSMSTPCVTDWDQDGDWDIVCGDSNGYISLILNKGAPGKPDFTRPEYIRGEDIYKSMKAPSGWKLYTYHSDSNRLEDPERSVVNRLEDPRKGAYQICVDEDAYSGQYSLKVFAYDKFGGEVYAGMKQCLTFERGQKYKLTFYTKGRNARCKWRIHRHGEYDKVVEDGRSIYKNIEPLWIESDDFRPGSAWKKVTGRFKAPEVEDKEFKEKLGKTKTGYLDFYITGAGPVWIDDVSVVKD